MLKQIVFKDNYFDFGWHDIPYEIGNYLWYQRHAGLDKMYTKFFFLLDTIGLKTPC